MMPVRIGHAVAPSPTIKRSKRRRSQHSSSSQPSAKRAKSEDPSSIEKKSKKKKKEKKKKKKKSKSKKKKKKSKSSEEDVPVVTVTIPDEWARHQFPLLLAHSHGDRVSTKTLPKVAKLAVMKANGDYWVFHQLVQQLATAKLGADVDTTSSRAVFRSLLSYKEDHTEEKKVEILEVAPGSDTCPKCGCDRVHHSDQHGRGADEGSTMFFQCSKESCKHKWTFEN